MRPFISVMICAAAAAGLTLSSCESASRLAKELDGSWSGAPVKLSDDMSGIVTGIDNFVFTREGDRDGNIEIATMISFDETLPADSMIVQPLSVTIAGIARAQGSWVATDDDEVSVTVDPESITVEIDPQGVTLNTSLLTGADAVLPDSIAPALAQAARRRILRDVTTRYYSLSHLDDVKVKDNRLIFEIGREHYIMSRQEQPQ